MTDLIFFTIEFLSIKQPLIYLNGWFAKSASGFYNAGLGLSVETGTTN